MCHTLINVLVEPGNETMECSYELAHTKIRKIFLVYYKTFKTLSDLTAFLNLKIKTGPSWSSRPHELIL